MLGDTPMHSPALIIGLAYATGTSAVCLNRGNREGALRACRVLTEKAGFALFPVEIPISIADITEDEDRHFHGNSVTLPDRRLIAPVVPP